MELGTDKGWYLVDTYYYGNLEYVQARIEGSLSKETKRK